MELSLKPDYELSRKRYDAFWHHEVADRPPVCMRFRVDHPKPVPQKQYGCHADRWLDVDFRAEQMAIELANFEYSADALPVAWPNMGPEVFSAWCGCEYEFGENTTWSKPCIENWETDGTKAVFNPEHPLFIATVKFTERLIDLGKGHFLVGLTDFHPGGDHLAALRDPANLALDMLDYPHLVQEKLESSLQEYFAVYDIFFEMLKSAGMPITSWTPLIHDGRYYIPSNDFSCMVSREMFDDIFLPGIAAECKFYDRSIYHLDGPKALRHLDSILEISDLDAVQWVCGAGNEGYAKWVDVYQKIQAAGKSLQVNASLEELPLVFETLRPEGVWFSNIPGIHDRETADRVLQRISRWR